MGMFCNQCQETARGTGCEFGGVCGKSEDLADLQDLLIYTIKGIAQIMSKGNLAAENMTAVHEPVLAGLFMTITNANFDDQVIIDQIWELLAIRDQLRQQISASVSGLHDAATYEISSLKSMLFKASYAGYSPKEDEDLRSLRQLITFGMKGFAAYLYHARHLGKEDPRLYDFMYEALSATLSAELSGEDLVDLIMKTGEYAVMAMALLDQANTSTYGNPEITEVSIGVRENPGILISGHDLSDLEQLLQQTAGTGVDVYTHGEMLPAHSYPAFKKYRHLAGNYGNAWWQQSEEFKTFHGPVLFTTNCITPPLTEEIHNKIFTTGAAGFPGCTHINTDAAGRKDFSPLITLAKKQKPPEAIESGTVIGGFAHAQVLALTDQILAAVKTGAIKQFVVMAGCDGSMKSRSYYTEFAQKLPKDTVILTAGCAKYRYHKLPLGEINGIPRVLDAGQCNDSYSLALIALKLKEALGLDDINQLPIVYNIAWYEQKAIIVLLALLFLGVKDIHLGPTLPAFLSPRVAGILTETFGITGISTVNEDILQWL